MGQGGAEVNTRLLYVLLAVQFLFAGALIFVGEQVRSKRRLDYLELTHRVTSGRARRDDFEKLAALLPERAERPEVRALFGLPLLRADGVDSDEAGQRRRETGEFWIYYFAAAASDPENPPAPFDKSDAEKLSGIQNCFVIAFDAKGRATAKVMALVHPITAH